MNRDRNTLGPALAIEVADDPITSRRARTAGRSLDHYSRHVLAGAPAIGAAGNQIGLVVIDCEGLDLHNRFVISRIGLRKAVGEPQPGRASRVCDIAAHERANHRRRRQIPPQCELH
jgi:hypothetical protein